MMYSPVDVSRIQYMTLKQQRSARRKRAQKQLTQQMAKVAIAPTPKKKKNKPFATVGQTLGSAVGSMFGVPSIGSGVGRWLGKGIGSIFGSGDYQMVGQNPSYNVLTNGAQIPKFSTTRATNIVSHREYLGDITGTAAFLNRSFPLNPGVATTFPWLCTIAQNYQQYKFHGLIFEFRPLITDFVTNGAPGVVVMATNYNSDVAAYTTKQEMENSEYAVSVKPTCSLMHGVECAANQTVLSELYVRSGTPPTGQDLRLYDLGNFQFATQSNPVQNLGELWVSYTVEFFKPILPDDVGGNVLSSHLRRTGVTNALPLGDTTTVSTGDLGATFASQNIIWTGQPGNSYYVTLTYFFPAGAPLSLPVGGVTLAGLAFNQTIWSSPQPIVPAPAAGTTANIGIMEMVVTCTATSPSFGTNNCAIGFTTGTFPANGTLDVVVTTLSSNAT